jgi:hypothetical protein
MFKSLTLGAALAFTMLSLAFAQSDVRTETVRFPRGSSGTTIEDSITRYESVRYSVGV